jgi:hypothetical protein
MSKHIGGVWILICASAVFTLLPVIANATPIGPITNVVVEENGIGPKADSCHTFVITPKKVRAFFAKAVLISGRQEHDFFLHGPCSARGTLQSRYDTWHWEIRNLGTATITATNGDVFVLGDPSQESSLADE